MSVILPGANDITVEDIENFLNGGGDATPASNDKKEGSPADEPNQNGTEQPTDKNENKTQAFAHRLKEETTKIRNEERENIAKSLGYESFAAMQKSREDKLLADKGLNPEDVSPVVEELVKKRLDEDPRMKEIEAYRKEKMATWAKQELTELSELTGGKISKIEDVPKDVIELWKKKGTLKGSYLELHGEELIKEARSSVIGAQSKGSTSHMQDPASGNTTIIGNKRPLTQEEKNMYKFFNPQVTDEQLNKMLKEK